MFNRSRKLFETVKRTFSRKNNRNQNYNEWKKKFQSWKKTVNENFEHNMNYPAHYNQIALGIIGANVSLYLLYKFGIPSRNFYVYNVSVNQSTNNPFSYFLSNFYHEDLLHLLINCFATYQILNVSQTFLPKKAILITFLVTGTLGNYSAKQSLMEK